jgi:predicted phosphate transport protein (TIGR00153 family)
MFNLMPKETVFFDLFEKSAENVHEAAKKLVELLEKVDNLPARVREIKDLEHAGDRLTHEMIERINRTFITPLEREDIHELACRMDDILDLMDTAVNRMMLYKIGTPTEDAKALGRCLEKATGIIRTAMPCLRRMNRRQDVEILLRACVDVHSQENEGDRIEQHALAALFENDSGDPIRVIKWKDIYQDLEAATDRCEDVANVIEALVLKNA